MEAVFEGGQGPEGAVVPWMYGGMDAWKECVYCALRTEYLYTTEVNLSAGSASLTAEKRFIRTKDLLIFFALS